MPSPIASALKRLRGAFLHPARTYALITRRLIPTGVILRDPDAYAAVGGWTFGRLPRVTLAEVFPGIQAEDVLLLRAHDRKPDTSLTVAESATVGAIARHVAARRVLEIGTFDGNTTLTLAANSPDDSRITTVDLPPDWQGSLHLSVSAEFVNVTNRERVGSQATRTAYARKVSQVFGDSAQLDWNTLGGPFDLIFIDGCHAYDYVRSDTANARRHLAPGGLLVWHDYGMIDDVSRAVDEVSGLKLLTAIRGTRLAIGVAESG